MLCVEYYIFVRNQLYNFWYFFTDIFDTYVTDWNKDDKKFYVTLGTQKIDEILREKNCVLVVGHSRNGKSAIIRHIALKLFNEDGYDIVPIVLDPTTILQYHNAERKQIFVIDDFCGKAVINPQHVEIWSLHMDDILNLIINNQENTDQTLGKGNIKLLFATVTDIFEDSLFNRVNCPSKFLFNLSELPLQENEKIEMLDKYFTQEQMADSFTTTLKRHEDMYPFLCKLSIDKSAEQIIQLFTNPNEFIRHEFLVLKETNKAQMCLIALCVLLESIEDGGFWKESIPAEDRVVIEAVLPEFDLYLYQHSSRSKLDKALTYLENTYFVKAGHHYHFAHKNIYDIAAVFCGEILSNIFIRFAPSSFIANRYSFMSSGEVERPNLIFIHNEETQKKYFDRLMNDLEQIITFSTFHNSQLNNDSYRDTFCKYCTHRTKHVKDLLNKLQRHSLGQSENGTNDKSALTENGIYDYEDYIDFTEQFQFLSHKMKKPLIESAWEGYEDIVNLLINMDCDINETDRFGRSALFVACYLGRTNVAIKLMNIGANHSLCDANGVSPLFAACRGGYSKIVEALLENEADMLACNTNGFSPLLVASEAGHINIVEQLLQVADQKNVNIFQNDNLDRSAVFLASINGRKDVVDSLLKKGADLEKCDKKGLSPLIAACSVGKSDVVIALLEKTADMSKIDNAGRSALLIACEKEDNRIVHILLKNKADVSQCNSHRQSPLFIACALGVDAIVRSLVDYGADISQCDEHGRSPFFIACEQGHATILNILLPECDVEILEKADNEGRSPLFIACKGGFIEIVKTLVLRGAQINRRNILQMTPLFVGCTEGHIDVIQYLVTAKADLNLPDFEGRTPLSVARDLRYADVVAVLVENGADVNHTVTDDENFSRN